MAVAAVVVVVVADMPSAKSNTAQPGGGRIEVASRSAPAPNYLQACALQIGNVLASRKVPRRMMSASSLED